MNRKIAFLSNPVSGTVNKLHFKKIIQEEMLPSGIPFEFVDTNAQGSYPELEKRILKDEITDVVVVGGDGTIRSVSAALRHTNARFGMTNLRH